MHWAKTLPIDGAGVRCVDSPSCVTPTDHSARAEALDTLGYATLRATTACEGAVRRAWLHRHVALIVDDAPVRMTRRWIRDLAITSPRPHLVVMPLGPAVSVVRERVPLQWPGETGPADDRRLRTASRCLKAGRLQTALTWMRAAVGAAARRPHDEQGRADALWRYGRLVLRHRSSSALRHLVRLCREALRQLEALVPRSLVAALGSEALCLLAEVETATAWRKGVEAECLLASLDVPPWILAAEVDAALWEGRWEEAARTAARLPVSTPARERRALAAWLRGDDEEVRRLAEGSHDGWMPVLGAMVRGDRPAAAARAETLLEGTADVWTTAIAAVALQRATSWLRRRDLAPAEAALRAQVTGAGGVGADGDALGVPGVGRWGERRRRMTRWSGVAALLEELNGADDDRTAVRRGCRWVRTHTGTRYVAVTDRDGRWVAGDPDTATPAPEDLRVPIRCSGTTIGWVVAGRQARDPEDLAGSATALAGAAASAVRACLDAARTRQAGDALATQLRGRSAAMAALRAAVARAAPTTFPVLIEGESGVGKELVARAIHQLSARRDRHLAAVNCAAFTDELFEAEVFGHTRGAFTGAVGARAGLFEDAHAGTLFLDEVGELSPRAQAKLLRVLQEGEIRRVGDTQPRRVDVRVVAATNRPLFAAAASGGFREDLIFRLAVVRLVVPPLRDRLEDVPELAESFWASAVSHRPTRASLGPDALAALCRHRWPGNVRELQNVMAGLVLAAPARGRVTARHVASVLSVQDPGPVALVDARDALDRRLVAAALARQGGCRAAAARELGLSRQGLLKLMARLQIEPGVASGHDLR